jgi:hypothetical protein
MPADLVFHDAQQYAAAVRVERVPGGQEELAGLVQRPAGGNDLGRVMPVEGEQVGDLFAQRINHDEALAAREGEGGAAAGRDFVRHKRGSKAFVSDEKKQKTFVRWCVRSLSHVGQVAKVFWFFLSKKNIF